MSESFSQRDGGHCSNRHASRQAKSPTRARLIALTLALLLLPRVGLAWLFPEHRDIMVRAIEKLDPAQREALDKLWSEARSGHEARLCPEPADSAQPAKPTCIDYASWPAIAGDHSCSAKEMLGTVLDAPWILEVAQISAKLKAQLAAAKRRDQQVNAVRDSNLALQRADTECGHPGDLERRPLPACAPGRRHRARCLRKARAGRRRPAQRAGYLRVVSLACSRASGAYCPRRSCARGTRTGGPSRARRRSLRRPLPRRRLRGRPCGRELGRHGRALWARTTITTSTASRPSRGGASTS